MPKKKLNASSRAVKRAGGRPLNRARRKPKKGKGGWTGALKNELTALNIAVAFLFFAGYGWTHNFFLSAEQAAAGLSTLAGWAINLFPPLVFSALFIFLSKKKYACTVIGVYLVFLLIVASERLNFDAVNLESAAASTAAAAFIMSLLVMACQFLRRYKAAEAVNLLLILPLCCAPLIFVIYSLSHRTKISEKTIQAMLQTNMAESYEYVSSFISGGYVLFFCLVICTICFLVYRQAKAHIIPIRKEILLPGAAVFLLIALATYPGLNTYTLLVSSTVKYKKALAGFEEVHRRATAGDIRFFAEKEDQNETYLVILGESLNKNHMGLYGYMRDTTPMLSRMKNKNQLLVFDNVYSSHTHTEEVLRLALTEANQYNGKHFYDSLSVMEILKKTGIETHWLSNQFTYGIHGNFAASIAKRANNLVALNDSISGFTDYHDGALIEELLKILSTPADKNRVIFVHLIGSHFEYILRYPHEQFSVYKGGLQTGEYGAIARNPLINYYDNSVVYNDYVVASLFDALAKHAAGKVAGAIYMGDHSEYVARLLGHNSDNFQYEMTSVPLAAWFSEEYKERHQDKHDTLRANTGALYSNDMFYDTLIGILNIKTDRYSSQYDLSSAQYSLAPQDALVLEGKGHYAAPDNHIYWQRRNTRALKAVNQADRIYPHRINTTAKLHEIWREGFRSFEVDALFRDYNAKFFQVGHHEGVMGLPFSGFLDSIEHSEIQKIWLDFKNLSEGNHQNALRRLNELDRKYRLKGKMIVESQATGDFFKAFRDAGWHTSYYMPTGVISNLIKAKDEPKMRALALQIAGQIRRQNVSAVSFDHNLYPFVKYFLEPNIDQNVVYHTWGAPDLWDSRFEEKLQNYPLYLDSRVKTLLAQYKSDFHL